LKTLIRENNIVKVSRKLRKPVVGWPALEKDSFLASGNKESAWKKYCGFLELSIDEFMSIQRLLLMEQMELVAGSKLGALILGDRKPGSMEDFRSSIPLTVYRDYQPYLGEKDEKVLAGKPVAWVHSSGRTGPVKWVPFFIATLNGLADDAITAFILSSASREGEVLLQRGSRILLNLPVTRLTDIIGRALHQRIAYQVIPSLEQGEQMSVKERMEKGLRMALGTGLDYAGSVPAILARAGDNPGRNRFFPGWHPMAFYRCLAAAIKSKLMKRPILLKDIWKAKGLISTGDSVAPYRDLIYQRWGIQPLDMYTSTETCSIAVQGWNKRGMTLIPSRHFYEFIPEKELVKSRDNPNYQPSTLLLNELEAGKVYELVVTNFHGGPFLRYRIGDLIKVVSLADEETGVNLPQITFFNRTNGVAGSAAV